MRKLIILMLIGISTSMIQAQSEKDALRYSFLTHGGTARYMGMSGAFGALGADFSSLSTNPAGIGSYRSSSIMFTPSFEMNGVDASYKNKFTNTQSPYINLNNFGFVINFKSADEGTSGWKSVGLALGYNKIKSFNQDITISGFNDQSSRLDQFMLNSDGQLPKDLYSAEWAVYKAQLIDTIPNSGYLYINPYYNNNSQDQRKRIVSTGGIGEYVIGFGGNYNDVLQVGVSVGFQNVRYTEKATFTEGSDYTDLISYDFIENLETKGTGFNFKFGLIYKPIEILRLGVAIHTPTFYNMTDYYSYEAQSYYYTPDSNGDTDYYSNGDGELESTYELYTPMRLITSAAVVIPKFGIVSADYEYVKYFQARLRSNDLNFDDVNDTIQNIYKSGHNLRLGAELRLSPLYLRGGLSYYSSPDRAGKIGAISGYSFGLGIRTKNTFIDFGYNYSSNDLNYKLYEYETGIETSNLKYKNNMFCFTLGFSF